MKFESLVDIEGAQLLKLNLKDHVRPKRDIFVGAATKRLLQKLRKARKKDVVEDFLDKVKNAFVETGIYIQKIFPLANSLLKKLSALDPIARGHTVTHRYLSDLPAYFPTIISEENEDAYLREIMEYQTADLPPPTTTTNEEVIYVPLDEWWAKVFETGKFPVLEKLVTAALSIFTGPHVEASFSLMKHIIDPKANRTCVHTYSSIMDIKYHMLSTGKTSEKLFHRKDFNRDPINPRHSYYIRTAHSRYKKRMNAAKLSRQTKQVGLTGVKSIPRMSPKKSKGKKKTRHEEPPTKKKKENETPHTSPTHSAAPENVCLGTKKVTKHKAFKQPTLSEMFKGK